MTLAHQPRWPGPAGAACTLPAASAPGDCAAADGSRGAAVRQEGGQAGGRCQQGLGRAHAPRPGKWLSSAEEGWETEQRGCRPMRCWAGAPIARRRPAGAEQQQGQEEGQLGKGHWEEVKGRVACASVAVLASGKVKFCLITAGLTPAQGRLCARASRRLVDRGSSRHRETGWAGSLCVKKVLARRCSAPAACFSWVCGDGSLGVLQRGPAGRAVRHREYTELCFVHRLHKTLIAGGTGARFCSVGPHRAQQAQQAAQLARGLGRHSSA